MRSKDEQDSVPPDSVCCPVCTLYLRKEVTLQEHLDTHPKEQVIEALVRVKDACKELFTQPAPQRRGSFSAGSSGSDANAISVIEAAGSLIASIVAAPEVITSSATTVTVSGPNVNQSTINPVPPLQLPAGTSSHFLPFPPFLNSLGGTAPVPQYISVPVVESSTPHQNPTQASVMQMLYNPYVYPATNNGQAAEQMDPSHLQFLAISSMMRSPFHVLQASSSPSPAPGPHLPPAASVPITSSLSQALATTIQPPYVQIDVPASSGPVTLTLNQDGTSFSLGTEPRQGHLPTRPQIRGIEEDSVSNDHEDVTEDNAKADHATRGDDSMGGVVHMNQESGDRNMPENCVSAKEESVTEVIPITKVETVLMEEDSHEGTVEAEAEAEEPNPEWLSTTDSNVCSETLEGGEGEGGREGIGSPRPHSSFTIVRNPRLQTVADCSLVCKSSPSPQTVAVDQRQDDLCLMEESNMETIQDEPENQVGDCVDNQGDSRDEVDCKFVNKDLSSAMSSADDSSSLKEQSTPPNVFAPEVIVPDSQTSAETSDETSRTEPEGLMVSMMSSGHAMKFLMPSHFLGCADVTIAAKQEQITEPRSPGHSPYDSGPPSPYQSVDSPIPPLNIQTDETMPPRGELSEQESNGGNSSSMWSVPPYRMTGELLSPVVMTSYDLTARESWAGSDISDECNANQVPENSLHQFSSAPSFSNALPSIIPQSSNADSIDRKHLTISPTSQGRGKATAKAPPKPRVYKCKACSLEFNCPKERRVHPCEKKKEPRKKTPAVPAPRSDSSVAGSSTSAEKEAVQPKPKRVYKRKPKVKTEILSENRSAEQSQFGGVFMNMGQINKLEPEDSSESRTPNQIVPDLAMLQTVSANVQMPTQAIDGTYGELPIQILDQKPDLKQLSMQHKCTKCGIVYSSDKDLNRHRTLKHKEERYQCTTCGEAFEKESLYFDHLLIHPLECRLCGKCFHRRKSLNLHMKRHMDVRPYKCDSCEKSFVTRQKLEEHQNTHTGNAPIKCPLCDETFKRYSNLIQHKNKHHLNVKRKIKDYICHCGEVFHTKKKLEWHKEIHDDKPKCCHYCSERYVHTASLTRHIRKAHDKRYVPRAERATENVECPVCKAVFLKSSLPNHMKIHNGERSYPCHICGKDFTTKWNLHIHRWTHASRSSKPFKCTLCKAAFYRKQDYSAHMRSHRNVRPFTCNHCGCQFIRKYNCLRHMKEHEAQKNYTCNICNKTFHRSYYLKDHMRVHSGARPFTCHICGKTSTTKANHNRHVIIHHAREPQNTEI